MPTFVPTPCNRLLFQASMRDTSLSITSGEGWTYRCDTVTVLWAISFMIVNAWAPVSPNLVPYVCRKECATKSAGIFKSRRRSSCRLLVEPV